MAKKHVSVVAAIVESNDKYLCVQRGPSALDYISKKWEFPGGKVEAGETNEVALVREMKEELSMDIQVKSHFLTVEHEYPDFIIKMASYLCVDTGGQLTLSEHLDFKYLAPHEIKNLDWAAADIPIVEALARSTK